MGQATGINLKPNKKKMKDSKRNFIKNPSKKNLVTFTILWLLGIVLLTLSITNLFTESFFQGKYVMIYLLMIGSTIATIKLYRNYWRNRNLNTPSD